MSYNHHQHYGHQQAGAPMYTQHGEYADIHESAVAEPRSDIFPASHPLFTREEISNTRTLDPYPSTQSPRSWTPYEPPFHPQPLSYAPYPSPSPFPPPRLSPPPTVHHQTFHFKAPGQSVSPGSASHRLTLAGSLDPATGIFYRTPEHPRLRTAQACEKCRTRKAKCSGEHPSCKRCITRGLICEYAKEGRVRGPNKPKSKPGATSTASPCASTSSTSTGASAAGNNETTPTSTKIGDYGGRTALHRPPSSQSSGGSSDQTPNEASGQSLFLPPSDELHSVRSSRGEYPHESLSNSPPSASPSFPRGRRSLMDSGPTTASSSRQNSLGEHPSPRSHPLDIHAAPTPSLFRLSAVQPGSGTAQRSGSLERVDLRMGEMGSNMGARSLPEDPQFYPYQQPPQHQQQHHLRTGHEHDYLPDTMANRHGQHTHRYQPPIQSYQQFQTQRDPFPIHTQQQYEGLQGTASGVHSQSLGRVGVTTESRRTFGQGHHSFPPQSHISSHAQQFVGHQPQQHSLVPIQLGLNIPGHHLPPRRHEHECSEELAYPNQSTAGTPFFRGQTDLRRSVRATDSTTSQHQSQYDMHETFRHPEPYRQHQQSLLSQHEDQMSGTVMQYASHRSQAEYPTQSSYEEPVGQYTSMRTTSGAPLPSSSPLTPASASTSASASEMLLYHYAAAADAAGQGMSAAGSTSSFSMHETAHQQGQAEDGSEMPASHSLVSDVEVESRLGGYAAVQQRGNGLDHGCLSVSGNLANLAESAPANGRSPGGHEYGSGSVAERGGVLNDEEDAAPIRTA